MQVASPLHSERRPPYCDPRSVDDPHWVAQAIHCAHAATRDQDVELVGLNAADVDHLHHHLLALERRGTIIHTRMATARELQT